MRFGPFEVLDVIGRGGAGTVFRARAPSGQEVAVKQLARGGAEALARFVRERRLQGELGDAEGFVPLIDSGEAPGGPWMAMPLLRGGTLRERLARGPLGADDALALGVALARAMGRAHRRGLVHRDLKPENVLFDEKGAPRIADLGLAKHFETGASVALSQTGAFQGTAGYMAPEQMHDSKNVGPACDVFALGAILHECLTGEHAFRGRTLLEVITAAERGERRKVRSLRPEVPRSCEEVLERALAREPADRFVDAEALADALAAARRGVAKPRIGKALLAAVGGGAVLLLVAAGALVLERGAPRRIAVQPPAAPAVPRAVDIAALISRAWEANPRDHQEALAIATRAIEAAPNKAAGWVARGGIHLSRREIDEAIVDLKKATSIEPKHAHAWFILGQTYFEAGRLDESLDACNEACRLAPDAPGYYSGRAAVREKRGDLQGAIDDMKRMLDLKPDDEPGWERRFQLCSLGGDFAEALACLKRAIEITPGDKILWYDSAALKVRLRDFAGALADAEQTLRIDPSYPNPWIVKGTVHREQGLYAEALDDFARGLAAGGDRSILLYNRAIVRKSMKDWKAERGDLEEALRANPTPNVAESARKELAALDAEGK